MSTYPIQPEQLITRADGITIDAANNIAYIEPKATPPKTQIPSTIELTLEEWGHAAHFAVNRRVASAKTPAHNAVKNKTCTLNTEADQCAAVVAAAKALGRPYVLNIGTFQPDNVAGIRIRHTAQPNGKLRVYDDQPITERCLLVTGKGQRYRLIGWLTAGDARRIGSLVDLNGSGKKCWAVPQSLLKPISELGVS